MSRILVTGAAGFLGSHLCEKLVESGNEVVGVDNLVSGSRDNLDKLWGNNQFKLVEADASRPVGEYFGEGADQIYHLASLASPKGYQAYPVETYLVNAMGTHYLCEYASKVGARVFFASTSEVYGDPLEHPQTEEYRGNVSIRGVRACYDESKRFGEMVQTVWQRDKGLDIRTVRIFNTYGPRMAEGDGRVIPNFITQALSGKPITVYGDGSQTRSFCFVSDLIEGFERVMNSEESNGEVYNLGNPDEYSMKEMAEVVREAVGSESEIVYEPLPEDDPVRRKPDIAKIREKLGWEPKVDLKTGLAKTIEYFRELHGRSTN